MEKIKDYIIENNISKEDAEKSYYSSIFEDLWDLENNKILIWLSEIISDELNINKISVNKILDLFNWIYKVDFFINNLDKYKFLSQQNKNFIKNFLESEDEKELEITTQIAKVRAINVLEWPLSTLKNTKLLNFFESNKKENIIENLKVFLDELDEYNNEKWDLSKKININILS